MPSELSGRRLRGAVLRCCILVGALCAATSVLATQYYVSSSEGDDDAHSGQSAEEPFASITKVNGLDLQPGDSVALKCGDVWRAQKLIITAAGTETLPITFGSYPEGCTNQPVLSGAQTITGWTSYSGNIWVATLSTGANAGKFALGINQLFKDSERLPFGRWPNLDAGAGGYSSADGYPAANQLVDNQLPAANWTGAILRIKTQRWLLVNREVTASSGATLTLNDVLSCRGGTCEGWGFFLQNHLSTLDQEGEWYFDSSSNQVYLYTSGGAPSGIEGSVIVDDTLKSAGVVFGSGAAWVTVENLAIVDWFYNAVAGAAGASTLYHHLQLRGCLIRNPDSAGIQLSTWLNSSSELHGGYYLTIKDNLVEGANHFGITGFFSSSTIEGNTIRDIGLIANLNLSGMGCGTTGASCTENGDGIRVRRFATQDSGEHNTIRYNTVERTGYNGLDVFGPYNTVEENFFEQPCYSKGDCGGIRTFGDGTISTTSVHDLTLDANIIVDSIGNVDGVHLDYRQPFGMGIYIDNYSRDVLCHGNTVINSTFTGLLYQRSTGQILDNTLYNCSTGIYYAGHITLAGAETEISQLRGNVMYGLADNAWTLVLEGGTLDASDDNYFFHPFVDKQVTTGGWSGRKTFAEWQAFSDLDGSSRTNWFTLGPADDPLSQVLYNPSQNPQSFTLQPRQYLDLDQQPVVYSVVVAPYSSVVLVDNGASSAIFADGFELGTTSAWSGVIP